MSCALVGHLIRIWLATPVDPIVDDRDALGGQKGVLNNCISHGPADANNVARLLETTERAAHHAAEPTRTRLRVWLDQASECIQIVTGHDGPPRWKRLNKLSVAMVHHVIEVIALRVAIEPSRIVHEPVNQTIRVPSSVEVSENRQGSKPAAEQRSNLVNPEIMSVPACQLLEEHIRDQIHARPFFLMKIAHQRESNHRHTWANRRRGMAALRNADMISFISNRST
jgi:hypothetical protein